MLVIIYGGKIIGFMIIFIIFNLLMLVVLILGSIFILEFYVIVKMILIGISFV